MYALNCIVVDPSGNHRTFHGTLHSVPVELRSGTRITQVIRTATPGWSLDDWGYSSYSADLPSGERVIVFGLLIEGQKAGKKIHGYSKTFTKLEIEGFAQGFFEALSHERTKSQNEVNNLIHDLRSLSATIYHSTNEAGIFLEQENLAESAVRLRNIEAAQGLLKIRIDAYDYLANANALRGVREIAVFRKVDKVVRFLKSNAANSNKILRLTDQSYRKVIGPDLLELLPYPVIDNALKYSPAGSIVNVDIQEDDLTRIMVTSLGPRITRNEQDSIFNRGSRGEGAVATGLPGSGLGLHVARRIAEEVFSGNLRVQQSPTATVIDGVNFYETTFTIELPTVP